MSTSAGGQPSIAWWKEPTKDQWFAWTAAWLGWTLDAFDFTIFLLIMVPVAREFNVPLAAVTVVFTFTVCLRLFGAIASGWLADRIGRKTPLMISIMWFSLCNCIAGFSPTFLFLVFFRSLLGVGMGAEWPAGMTLAMESWPARSRGLMSGLLQGSWAIGLLLSYAAYGLLYAWIGWRGLLFLGVLPALAVFWMHFYVKDSKVWLENREQQRLSNNEARLPLPMMFRRGSLANTLTACWWAASASIVYSAVPSQFATHVQRDLHVSPAEIGTAVAVANLLALAAGVFWGWVADSFGRRRSMIVLAVAGMVVAPVYLLSNDPTWTMVGFMVQGLCAGAISGQTPSYLSERFPTEVRSTAIGFCYQQGTIWGGFVAPIIVYFATKRGMGFGVPMLICTVIGLISFVLAVLLGPETKGRVFVAGLGPISMGRGVCAPGGPDAGAGGSSIMGPGEAIGACFAKYATFSGRAERPEFWYWLLFILIASIVLFIIQRVVPAPVGDGLWLLLSLAALLPTLAVTARRLHDVDYSGWCQLVGLIPVFGAFILLMWLVDRGVSDSNRFGSPPSSWQGAGQGSGHQMPSR